MPYTTQHLSDLQDIKDVLHSYCRAIDDNRPDDVIELFTEDCTYNYGGDLGSFSDKAYAYKFFRAGTDKIYKRSAHYISNIEVEFVDDDRARSVAYLDAWHEFHEDIDNAWIFGRYVDELVRTSDGWRICARKVETMGQESWPREVEYMPRHQLPPRA